MLLVQKKSGTNSSSSLTVTFSTATTAGNLLIAVLFSDNSSSDTFTPPSGWSLAKSQGNTTDGHTLAVYYAANIPGGTTGYTFSRSAGLFDFTVLIAEYSGLATTTPLDQTNSATGTSASITASSVTTTQASELLIMAGVSTGNAATLSAGTSMTLEDQLQGAGGVTQTGWEDRILSATGTYSPTMASTQSQNWTGVQVSFLAAASGGTNHGSATIFGMGGIFDGLAGQAGIGRGFSGGAGLAPGLSGSGGVGGGLSGHGDITAQSTALNSATAQGTGALGTGLSGNGALQATSTALANAIISGMGAIFTGLSGQGIIPAVAGSLGGAIHGVATLLGMGAMLLGFGGHGDVTPSSAATPNITFEGSGALDGGLAGSGSLTPSGAATPGITFQGDGALGGGLSGSGSVNASSAATPSLTVKGMGALLAGMFGGRGIIPPPNYNIAGLVAGIFRWLYTSAYNVLQQTFAPRQMQTMVFGGTAFLLMTFVREPTDMVTPNSTINVVMTAKKFDGTLMSNLATVTCTVTFPDGTTSAFSLGSGITNTGSGTYTLQYVTKGAGENVEDWVGTDTSGNTCEFHNITPVSF